MALGGWLPAAVPQHLPLFRMVSPGPKQERGCNLAPKLVCLKIDTTKLIGYYKACKKNALANCAELILWTSRTGD
jgi:hypothetical protein